jgi:hypothetical protein
LWSALHGWRFPAAAFATIGALLWAVVTVFAPFTPPSGKRGWSLLPNAPWFDGWTRMDGGWYRTIAVHGYAYEPGQDTNVAFFPAYPLLMRLGARITGEPLIAGVLITVSCGFIASILFHGWQSARTPASNEEPSEARWGTLFFLVYPCSFYLYGAVYADALFLVGALSAFLLLERDRPLLAGIAAAFATATRPVGLALVVGLVLRAIELRGPRASGSFSPFLRDTLDVRRLKWRDAGLLLSPLGIIAYAAHLSSKFGDPLLFTRAAGSPAWRQPPGIETWLKFEIFRVLQRSPWGEHQWLIVGHSFAVLLLVGSLPAVKRRFGWAYAFYAAGIVAIPIISTKDFIGMGRYGLAAFPCLAALGSALFAARRVRWPLLAASFASLITLTALFACWQYVS